MKRQNFQICEKVCDGSQMRRHMMYVLGHMMYVLGHMMYALGVRVESKLANSRADGYFIQKIK